MYVRTYKFDISIMQQNRSFTGFSSVGKAAQDDIGRLMKEHL